MGAEQFAQFQGGIDVNEAFQIAQARAGWEHGHSGYTGTIVEKQEYVVVAHEPLPLADAMTLAEQLLDARDARIKDKWGPAGAIRVVDETHNGWLFIGWASS